MLPLIQHRYRWLRTLALAMLASTLGVGAHAQQGLSEAEVKAAFVYNFARLVDWPQSVFANRDAPLLICLLGRDPVDNALPSLEKKRVKDRRIEVRAIGSVDEGLACHVLYLGASEARRLTPTLHSLASRPVLTISDIEGFIDLGGAIGLVYDDNRLQFEVNRQTLMQAQLTASSNLLKLARNLIDARK